MSEQADNERAIETLLQNWADLSASTICRAFSRITITR